MNEGIMRVSATERAEIAASRAKLHVRIEGETFVFGNAALTRSREVAEMVAKLKEQGSSDEDIQVTSVYTKTQSGLITKGSKAMFRLLITVGEVARLPDYLGVLAGQKNAEMERLEWVYEEDQTLLELSVRAMSKAHAKAQAMMAAIGYRVTGIRSCSDSSELPHTQDIFFQAEMVSAERMRKAAPLDVGTEFKATRELSATVLVEFTVAKAET